MKHKKRQLNISAKIVSYPIDTRIRGRTKPAKKPKKQQMDPPKEPVSAEWPMDLGSGPQPESRFRRSEKWFDSKQNTVDSGISVFLPPM